MAQDLTKNNNLENENLMISQPFMFARTYAGPLEKYTVFKTKEEALEYSKSKLAYIGQLVIILKDENDKITLNLIKNSEGEFERIIVSENINSFENDVQNLIKIINENIERIDSSLEENISNFGAFKTSVEGKLPKIDTLETESKKNKENISNISTEIDSIQSFLLNNKDEINTNKTNISEIRNNIIVINKNIENNTKNINLINENISNNSEQISNLDLKILDNSKNISRNNVSINENLNRISQLSSKINTNTSSISLLNNVVEENKEELLEEINKNSNKINALNNTTTQNNDKINSINEKIKDYPSKFSEIDNIINENSNKLNTFENDISLNKTNINSLNNSLQFNINDIKEEIKTTKEEYSEKFSIADGKFKEINERINNVSSEISTSNSILLERINTNKNNISSLTNEINEIIESISSLENDFTNLRNNTIGNINVKINLLDSKSEQIKIDLLNKYSLLEEKIIELENLYEENKSEINNYILELEKDILDFNDKLDKNKEETSGYTDEKILEVKELLLEFENIIKGENLSEDYDSLSKIVLVINNIEENINSLKNSEILDNTNLINDEISNRILEDEKLSERINTNVSEIKTLNNRIDGNQVYVSGKIIELQGLINKTDADVTNRLTAKVNIVSDNIEQIKTNLEIKIANESISRRLEINNEVKKINDTLNSIQEGSSDLIVKIQELLKIFGDDEASLDILLNAIKDKADRAELNNLSLKVDENYSEILNKIPTKVSQLEGHDDYIPWVKTYVSEILSISPELIADLKDIVIFIEENREIIENIDEAISSRLEVSVFNEYKGNIEKILENKLETSEFEIFKAENTEIINKKVNSDDFSEYKSSISSELSNKVSKNDFDVKNEEINQLLSNKVDDDEFKDFKDIVALKSDIKKTIDDLETSIGNLENNKQDKLISGENIKTINDLPILGEGNLEITSKEEIEELEEELKASISNIENLHASKEDNSGKMTVADEVSKILETFFGNGNGATIILNAGNIRDYIPESIEEPEINE